MKSTTVIFAASCFAALAAAAGPQDRSAVTGHSAAGAALYEKHCASCHGGDGLAMDGEAPRLAASSWVAGPESRLIRIVMHGVRGPITVGTEVHDREMPGFGSRLSDESMALLLSYVRARWSTPPGAPITPESVGRVRAAAGSRTRYWTVEELLNEP